MPHHRGPAAHCLAGPSRARRTAAVMSRVRHTCLIHLTNRCGQLPAIRDGCAVETRSRPVRHHICGADPGHPHATTYGGAAQGKTADRPGGSRAGACSSGRRPLTLGAASHGGFSGCRARLPAMVPGRFRTVGSPRPATGLTPGEGASLSRLPYAPCTEP